MFTDTFCIAMVSAIPPYCCAVAVVEVAVVVTVVVSLDTRPSASNQAFMLPDCAIICPDCSVPMDVVARSPSTSVSGSRTARSVSGTSRANTPSPAWLKEPKFPIPPTIPPRPAIRPSKSRDVTTSIEPSILLRFCEMFEALAKRFSASARIPSSSETDGCTPFTDVRPMS